MAKPVPITVASHFGPGQGVFIPDPLLEVELCAEDDPLDPEPVDPLPVVAVVVPLAVDPLPEVANPPPRPLPLDAVPPAPPAPLDDDPPESPPPQPAAATIATASATIIPCVLLAI